MGTRIGGKVSLPMTQNYTEPLLGLFHDRVDLIEELVGLSDNEKALKIGIWAKEKDKFGKPLIESPRDYRNKTKFAEALKENSLIKLSVRTFRDKL